MSIDRFLNGSGVVRGAVSGHAECVDVDPILRTGQRHDRGRRQAPASHANCAAS